MKLKDKRILIVGAGKTGKSTAKFLLEQGANVTLNDRNKIKFKINHNNFKMVENGHPEEIFSEADLIILSPGVNRKILPIPPNKEVIGDVELFYYFNKSKVIAITGTNGKTTTTYLTGKILETKYNVFVGGNIGTPAIEYCNEKESIDYAILELSSFQLENIKKFTPDIGVILNITPDHLDRYENFNEYLEAKLNLFKNNRENQIFIANESVRKFIKNKNIYFYNIDDALKNNKMFISYKNQNLTLDLNKILLKGKHFYEDIFIACLISLICNVDADSIKKIVYSFKGLEHRLEFVLEKDNIQFFNDSKSTTVSSTSAAIESFNNPVILILGGIDKGESFTVLKKYKNIKKVICFGKAKEKIAKDLEPILIDEASNLYDAVEKAKKNAVAGDIVLFSPACASFDMFKDYKERGRIFKEIING